MAMEHYKYQVSRLRGFAYAAFRRIRRGKCRGYSIMEPFFAEKCGLEIGGPSPIFGKHRAVPVYDRCQRVDGCNFSSNTIWGDKSANARYIPCLGQECLAEASNLSNIPDSTYDFVLASHVLEHVANPLLALLEWNRVLVPGGAILVMVPDKRNTFDHRRSITTFEHIEADFQANTGEDDLTHLDEILALHDLNLDPGAGSPKEFRERCIQNARFRAMHHHVFDPQLLQRMFERLGMRALVAGFEGPCHVVGFAQKLVPECDDSLLSKC